MHPEIEAYIKTYRDVTEEYIRVLRDEELTRLKALPTTNRILIDEWLNANKQAEEINQRRTNAYDNLRAALKRVSPL